MSETKRQITKMVLLALRLGSELKAIFPLFIFSNLRGKVRITEFESTDLNNIEQVRQDLLSGNQTIAVFDFGAGSKKNEAGVQKIEYIKDVCRIASKPKGSGMFLYRLIRQFKSENVLELGTCLGISTSYIGMALKHQGKGKLITMEGSPTRAKIAKENLDSLGLGNYVSVLEGLFQDILANHLENIEHLDFAFIDGHHDGEATVGYFNQLIPKFRNRGIMVFDDIYWSAGMNRAWKTIKRSPVVKDSFVFKGMGGVQVRG